MRYQTRLREVKRESMKQKGNTFKARVLTAIAQQKPVQGVRFEMRKPFLKGV